MYIFDLHNNNGHVLNNQHKKYWQNLYLHYCGYV